ncbi:hypothetical protein phiFa_08 [Thermus phage phiFa]|nr:hypothetical protein phiFa_08 [Thermus phage phiFa]
MFAEHFLLPMRCPSCQRSIPIRYAKHWYEPYYYCKECKLALAWDAELVLEVNGYVKRKRNRQQPSDSSPVLESELGRPVQPRHPVEQAGGH